MWAIGSLITEMLTGEPLFPGDSDIDQLYHITKCLGEHSPLALRRRGRASISPSQRFCGMVLCFLHVFALFVRFQVI